MNKAMELDPQNPRAHFLAGVGANFTPKLFGGGKGKARNLLKKAAQLFTVYQKLSILYPDWGERETYAWLGIIAADSDSLNLAKSYYEQALEIDPNFNWVKYQLLPELEKTLVKKKE
jgi:tetratricopeptide (TPR) repeat protein